MNDLDMPDRNDAIDGSRHGNRAIESGIQNPVKDHPQWWRLSGWLVAFGGFLVLAGGFSLGAWGLHAQATPAEGSACGMFEDLVDE